MIPGLGPAIPEAPADRPEVAGTGGRCDATMAKAGGGQALTLPGCVCHTQPEPADGSAPRGGTPRPAGRIIASSLLGG